MSHEVSGQSQDPDVLGALVARIREELTPTVELEVRGGQITLVRRKDFGIRFIIRTYDLDGSVEADVFQPWEDVTPPSPSTASD